MSSNVSRRQLFLAAPIWLASPAILTGCGGNPEDLNTDQDGADAPQTGAPMITRGPANRAEVALTFDDGPHATLTPQLLDILKEKKVKATFYVLGRRAEAYPSIIRRMRREGHEIGNHTWSHPILTNRSDAVLLSELDRTADAIQKAGGGRPKTMRPPFGAMTPRQAHVVRSRRRLPVVKWSIDSLDYTGSSSATITNRILRGAHNGAIILNHDIHARTVGAMPATIEGLKSKGYRFVTVSRLIG